MLTLLERVARIAGDGKQGGIEVVGGSGKEAAIDEVARFFFLCFGGVCLCACGRGADSSAFGRCRWCRHINNIRWQRTLASHAQGHVGGPVQVVWPLLVLE